RFSGRLRGRQNPQREILNGQIGCSSSTDGMGDSDRIEGRRIDREEGISEKSAQGKMEWKNGKWDGSFNVRASPTTGFWENPEWVKCRDGKYRPVEPGVKPLDHGIPQRMGKLRSYGNAIVPQITAEFIKAY